MVQEVRIFSFTYVWAANAKDLTLEWYIQCEKNGDSKEIGVNATRKATVAYQREELSEYMVDFVYDLSF